MRALAVARRAEGSLGEVNGEREMRGIGVGLEGVNIVSVNIQRKDSYGSDAGKQQRNSPDANKDRLQVS